MLHNTGVSQNYSTVMITRPEKGVETKKVSAHPFIQQILLHACYTPATVLNSEENNTRLCSLALRFEWMAINSKQINISGKKYSEEEYSGPLHLQFYFLRFWLSQSQLTIDKC